MASLVAPVIDHATTSPDAVALRGPSDEMTYGALASSVLAYGRMLIDLGVRPGDRVLFVGPTVPEFVVAYLGIQAAGAVVVPVNPLCRPAEIEYFLADAGCALAIAWEGLDEATRAACTAAEIAFVPLRPGAAVDGPPLDRPVDREPDEVACILYTSGTTGQPKGAELTIGNLGSAARIANALSGGDASERLGTGLPLFHVFGQVSVVLAGLHIGASISLMPRFTAEAMLATIIRDRLTIVSGVPTMWNAMLHYDGAVPDGAFDSLRLAVSGGASLPPEVNAAFRRRFGCDIAEGYGLTETAALGAFSRPGRPAPVGTVGEAVFDCAIEVRDDQGSPVAPGTRGEVFIRGPVVMRGYWNRPDATERTIDANGWLATGDIGELDAEGNLRIVDRAKDMIIRGGYNVYPSEVENVLYQHPDVIEAAVVGIPDDHFGEEIGAVIAVRADSAADDAEIRAWVAERLAAYKHPRAVVFTDSLPKGASGKILKRAIDPVPLASALTAYRASR